MLCHSNCCFFFSALAAVSSCKQSDFNPMEEPSHMDNLMPNGLSFPMSGPDREALQHAEEDEVTGPLRDADSCMTAETRHTRHRSTAAEILIVAGDSSREPEAPAAGRHEDAYEETNAEGQNAISESKHQSVGSVGETEEGKARKRSSSGASTGGRRSSGSDGGNGELEGEDVTEEQIRGFLEEKVGR